jgi:hypothetical protein
VPPFGDPATATRATDSRGLPAFHQNDLVTLKLGVLNMATELGGSRLAAQLKRGDLLRLGAAHPQGGGQVFWATVVKTAGGAGLGRIGVVRTDWIELAADSSGSPVSRQPPLAPRAELQTPAAPTQRPSVKEMYADYGRLSYYEFVQKYPQMNVVEYDRLGRQIAYDAELTRKWQASKSAPPSKLPQPAVRVPTQTRSPELAELRKWDVYGADPGAAFVMAVVDAVAKAFDLEPDPEAEAAAAAAVSLGVDVAGSFAPGAAAVPQVESRTVPFRVTDPRSVRNRLAGPDPLQELPRRPVERQGGTASPAEKSASPPPPETAARQRGGSAASGAGEHLRLMHGTEARGFRGVGGLGPGRISVTQSRGEDQDLGQGFYLTTDEVTAVVYAEKRNKQRNPPTKTDPGGGSLTHVLVFDVPVSDLGAIVDIRPGGNFRAQWEAFLNEPIAPFYPPDPQNARRAFLPILASKDRGVIFEEFLRSIKSQNADTIIAPLGDDVFPGIEPGYETTQVCIRSQRIADRLNAMMAGKPNPAGGSRNP